ncbi:MAG: hypothetical protein K2X66_01205, partial [Cyanobacteria bacterium]|nr:hypothetical protein [Cyanobacteriota bacterium]
IATLETIFMQEGTFSEALQKSINTLLTGLQGEMTLGGPEQKLCAHYQTLMNQLMKSEGKLFSLHTEIHPQTLVEKIEEILVGGLKRDRVFLKEALKTTNILIEDAKSYPHAEKVAEMSHAIGDYLHTFLRRVEGHLATAGEKGAVGQVLSIDTLKSIVTKFSEHSKWARMGVQFVAIPAAMLGLGVLIPKLQFLITKVLTGKNEHPGIAAVSHTEGAELYPGSPSENPAPNFGLHYQPLDRNHFQAFAR